MIEGDKSAPSGERSADIGAYTLPITDTQEKKRNFAGYQVSQPFSLEEILKGDKSSTTETSTSKKGK